MDEMQQKAQELLGQRVKLKRIEKGLTQEELGIAVDYSVQTAKQAISKIERGQVWIPNKKVEAFNKVLGFDPQVMSLVTYHYHARNYADVIERLEKQKDWEIKTRSQAIDSKLESVNDGNNKKETRVENSESSLAGLEEHLEALKRLREKELITEEEYSKMKQDTWKKFME